MALFTLDGIDQAIDSLNCQQATLRAKLITRIRSFYITTEDLGTLTTIPAADLIEELWDVHSPEEIKLKRRNLSGLKSSLNKALKTAIDGGGNPEGIIINKDNVFTVSEEKKNSLIEKLGLLGGKDSIADILNAVQELIKDSVSNKHTSDIESLIQQLDSTKAMLTDLGGDGGGAKDGEKTGGDGKDEGEDGDNFEIRDEIEEIDDEELIEVEEEEAGDGGAEDGEVAGADNEEDRDNFEVENEIEEIDDEELIEVEEEGAGDGGAEDGEVAGADNEEDRDNFEVEDEIEEIDDEELIEVEEEEVGDGGAEDGEVAGEDNEEDRDNFEVENEIEEIDDEELIEVEEEEVGDGGAEDGEVAGEDGGDEWDNFEVEDEIEEIDDEELIEVEEEEAGDGGAEDGEVAGDDSGDEWDNFEVEDEIEEIDEEEDGDGGAEDGEVAREDDGDDRDNFEVEDEIEEIDDEELIEVEEEDEIAGDNGGDDWDNFEVEDEIAEIAAEELIEVEEEAGDEVAEDGEEETALSKSLDLSQYIEPKEALDLGDTLQESNEEYIKQILDRFMPKFIKIPAGSYPVGAPRQRSSDRSTTTIELPSFFIGQHPITNDIFDFFIRETGYVTRAEQEGHGLVTSNRIHEATDRESGRAKIVINQGVSTTRTAGANWMHPDGPGSSLEGKGNHPVVQVSIIDAMAFAAWAGKRLPTEDEWEAAGRGKEGLLYPWGNQPAPLANLTNSQFGTTSEVGLYGRLSLSPFGLLDIIGNVAEWTSSSHAKGRHLLITKGGAWASETATCAARLIETKDTWSNTIGFRCCVNSPEG